MAAAICVKCGKEKRLTNKANDNQYLKALGWKRIVFDWLCPECSTTASGRHASIKDKNGKKIYEGIKVKINYGRHYNEPKGLTRTGTVIYDDKAESFVVKIDNSEVLVSFDSIVKKSIEIINLA